MGEGGSSAARPALRGVCQTIITPQLSVFENTPGFSSRSYASLSTETAFAGLSNDDRLLLLILGAVRFTFPPTLRHRVLASSVTFYNAYWIEATNSYCRKDDNISCSTEGHEQYLGKVMAICFMSGTTCVVIRKYRRISSGQTDPLAEHCDVYQLAVENEQKSFAAIDISKSSVDHHVYMQPDLHESFTSNKYYNLPYII